MAEALARIAPVTGLGMIAIRADETGAAIIATATGLPMPDRTGIVQDGDRALGWMSPDEWLLILPAADMPAMLTGLSEALMGHHALVADMSDARAVFDVIGSGAADVVAKLAPVDLGAMGQGHLRRTRMAQTAAAFWRIPGGFRVIGFRSTADYLRLILTNAAMPGSGLAPR